MRPVCAKCKKEMHCEKNGFMVYTNSAYGLSGDLYKCSKCGAMVVVGFGRPISDKDTLSAVASLSSSEGLVLIEE